MRALLVMVTLTMFFLAVSQLRAEQILGLIPFFFMGVICNAIAGAIQFSIADQVVIDDLLSYRISAGFFANINHFSSLLFITIPFLVYFGVVRGRTKLALLGLGGVLLMLLAAGSRAGVAMGFLILLASLIFLLSRSRATVGVVVTLFAGISIYGMGAWTKFESEFSNSDALRFEFVRTTWQGIKENWLLGVGYGNFEQAYQIYEKPEQIFRYFVNHAHNEYVQLVFEGGILSALLIGFYLILLHVQLWRSRADGLRKVAYLAVLFLLLHSLVDYPLRTFALVFPFVFFNAILFYLGSFSTKPMRDPVGEIDVDDEKLFHTAEIADVRDI
jgi:O-antigen ligase